MKKYFIVLIIAFAFFLRAWNLNSPFYGDETPFPYAAQDHSYHGFNFITDTPYGVFIWTSPPLAPFTYRLFTWPLGVTHVTMRLVPLLMGLVNIWLTYVLSKKLFGQKTALIAAAIMSLSFWHLLASFLIEYDGPFLTFFWLLFFHSYVNYEATKKTRWLLGTGAALGFGLLTKLTAGLMFMALAAYLLLSRRNIKYVIRTSALIFFTGFAIFSIFPILSLIINPAYMIRILSHSETLSLVPYLFSPVRTFIYLVLWATPLLAGLAFFSIFIGKKKDLQKKMLFLSWFGTVTIFYIFTKYVAAIDRYMSVMIPALCILAGYSISYIFERKDFMRAALFSLATLVFLNLLNFVKSQWIGHDVMGYLRNALLLKWDFIFQFHGGTGPSFMTSFIPLGAGIVLCGISFIYLLSAFARKDNKQIRAGMLIFVFLSLGFNLFLVQSFIIKAPYPDVGKNSLEMIDYLNKMEWGDKKVFLTDTNFGLYLKNPEQTTVVGYFFTNKSVEMDAVKVYSDKNGAILVISNYPKKPLYEPLWRFAETCRLEKEFIKKGFSLGYIYVCDKLTT
ncbi:glycosyltransferase family 39 protein [Candidatus Woesearchaeota archaeon]|nr:glycosyltransferase family 39 protein [Candidatus Woesearchaeota archaeon]